MPFSYECAGCGTQVTKRTRAQYPRVFCSRECYHRATVVYGDRQCPQCGITFSPRRGSKSSASRTLGHNRTYCTVACFRKSQGSVAKTCPVCGKNFTVGPAVADRGGVRTCSFACKTAETVYANCERCGKKFLICDRKRTDRRHCSEQCRRPPMYLNCQNCGIEFRKCPGRADKRFCSFACYRRFSGETLLESRVRSALELLGVQFKQEYQIGRWSIDFALTSHKIAIEADGDYWHAQSVDRDARRDATLARAGWRVVRLSEGAVNDTKDLCQFIAARLYEATGLEISHLAVRDVAPDMRRGQLSLW